MSLSPTGLARLRNAFALLAAVLIPASAAHAELRVTVSDTVVGQFESVGITVRDPKQGLDIKPGPLVVTMADSEDHKSDLFLEPTGRAGEWSGRFTPMRTGRYTGTALVDRGDQKDLGLVPLIRVRSGNKRGFVHLNPRTQRALQYSNGTTLFPIGVRLEANDLTVSTDWRGLFARLRANEVNFVEIPVTWPGEVSATQRTALLRIVDSALVEAERTGRRAVMLRLEAPADHSEAALADYLAQVRQYVSRWAYSPAVAVFYVAGAGDDISPELRQQWVRALREVDPYHHLIALPGAPGDRRAGGDILVLPWNWQRPVDRFALLEAPEKLEGPAPLPGESSWQMLVIGGVGLPLWPYHMTGPDGAAVLERVKRMARAAGRVQYQAPGQVLKNVVSVDTPGSFARYGRTCIGWVVPDTSRVLNLSALPRGKYRVRFFDPGQDVQVSQTEIWATGESARVELPQNLKAVYVQAEPVGGGEPVATSTRHTGHAERHHTYAAPRTRPRAEPVHVTHHKPTRAELRHQKALEKKEAARKAAEARRKKPKKLTRAELRHQKALEKEEAAHKAAEAKKHKPKKLSRAELRHQKALEKKAKKHDSAKKPTKKELAAKKKADAKKKAAAKKMTVAVKKKHRRR
jgi:hypothetical protein